MRLVGLCLSVGAFVFTIVRAEAVAAVFALIGAVVVVLRKTMADRLERDHRLMGYALLHRFESRALGLAKASPIFSAGNVALARATARARRHSKALVSSSRWFRDTSDARKALLESLEVGELCRRALARLLTGGWIGAISVTFVVALAADLTTRMALLLLVGNLAVITHLYDEAAAYRHRAELRKHCIAFLQSLPSELVDRDDLLSTIHALLTRLTSEMPRVPSLYDRWWVHAH